MRKLNYESIISKIQEWINDYSKTANVEGIVVGISGGIDSAVTSALCANAIGKENVIGLGLPCFSNPQDLNDAKTIANILGIKLVVLDLSSVFKEYLKISSPQITSNSMSEANLKARLRMMSYYFVGQSLGNYLVGGTGNRTEIAIGYFTKYGDGGVDFEPIGGLYKCEVREIAKLLNIPNRIINKPPSAGLWDGQTDEDEIGMKYDLIDEILYRLDYDLDLTGFNEKDIEKVQTMMESSRHKLMMPPTFRIKI
ncbi:MAG: NAD+ synthase [Candidatus Lokiarchaeota archaeon]|nr:NAD+ synthase [Candidatus Lokiarchaeota archaeon]